MTTPLLEIRDLHAEADGVPILRGIDLTVNEAEVHALMGPNGAGKSTLASVLLGSPAYTVTQGTITFQGNDVTMAASDERGKAGMFLAFQHPESISGVSVTQFLRQAMAARRDLDELIILLRTTALGCQKVDNRVEVPCKCLYEKDDGVSC